MTAAMLAFAQQLGPAAHEEEEKEAEGK